MPHPCLANRGGACFSLPFGMRSSHEWLRHFSSGRLVAPKPCDITLELQENGLFLLVLGEQIAQPVQPPLPERSAIGDPSLRQEKAGGHDTASSHPSRFFGMN